MDMSSLHTYIPHDDTIATCKIWDVRKFKITSIKFNIDRLKHIIKIQQFYARIKCKLVAFHWYRNDNFFSVHNNGKLNLLI